ncbi:MAG: DUF5005 domain-containing protein [Prevotella sp.]|nr:DUF5005 domain-containing protein [Prevotella sp.]
MKKYIFCVICAICGWTFTSCDDYDIVETDYDENMQVNPEQDSQTPPSIDAAWELEVIPDVGRQADNIFVYKDLKYNKIFSRTLGWTGGEGGVSTLLPDGSVLWAFNQSFFGTVDPVTRARLNGNEPANALLVQRAVDGKLGETQDDLICLADYVNWTDPSSEKYLWGRTYLRHPQGNRTAEQIENGEIDNTRVYRIGAASAASGKLQMLWRTLQMPMNTSTGVSVTTHSLSGSIPKGRYISQTDDYLPQEGDFLYQEKVSHVLFPTSSFFGQTLFTDDNDSTYLYAVSGTNLLVARVHKSDLEGAREYYVRDATTGVMAWQATAPSTSNEIARSGIMENGYVVLQPWVFKEGNTYYMLSQESAGSTSVYLYKSNAPEGPFTSQKLLFNLPSYLDKTGITSYNQSTQVNLHPELSRAGELVVSACTNVSNTADNYTYPGSADFTRPWFFRIFNWKNVYAE